MSTLIKFDLKELKQLANDKQSCIVEKTYTQSLALKPWCLGNLKESVKNILDCKIGKFVKELNGILISFKNVRILQNMGTIKSDNTDLTFQIQADYFVFQPYVGATLKGIVYKKNITHLGVLLHRVFNVVIPRPTDEKWNTWIGLNINENQEVVFKVVVLDLYGALPYIRGELDERWFNLVHGGVDEEGELNHVKTIDTSFRQESSDKPVPSSRNYNAPNNILSKNNTIENKLTTDENEVNICRKNRNKRYKDQTQKFCDADLKQFNPK